MKMKKFRLLFLAFIFSLGGVNSPAADTDSAAAPEATTYQIRNVKFQDLLRPRDANNANGTPIVLYSAQPWKCMTWRLQPDGDAFHLKNLFTGKTFCADKNSAQLAVTQIPLAKNGGGSPAWHFAKLADGSYKISDAQSGKVLTAVKNDGEYEAKIIAAPWHDKDEQKWRLEKMDPKQLTM